MKLLHFNDFQLGVLKGENVIDISSVVDDMPHTGPHTGPQDRIKGLIEHFDEYRPYLQPAPNIHSAGKKGHQDLIFSIPLHR